VNAKHEKHESMRCPLQDEEFASILLEYCDRTLAPDVAASLERHFEVCGACRESIEAQRAVWAALDEFKPESISAGFDEEVLSRVARERRPGAGRLLAWPDFSVRRVLPVAAAAMVLMAVGLFHGRLAPSAGEVEDSTRFMKSDLIVDVEQVDSTLDDIEMLRQMGLASAGAGDSRQL
jgi:anti-sigma factor RsiW